MQHLPSPSLGLIPGDQANLHQKPQGSSKIASKATPEEALEAAPVAADVCTSNVKGVSVLNESAVSKVGESLECVDEYVHALPASSVPGRASSPTKYTPGLESSMSACDYFDSCFSPVEESLVEPASTGAAPEITKSASVSAVVPPPSVAEGPPSVPEHSVHRADVSATSADGRTSPNRVHKRIREWLVATESDLKLCHVYGDGNCGWYALWISLSVSGCCHSPVLDRTPGDWEDFKIAVLVWAKQNMDSFQLSGVPIKTLVEAGDDLGLLERENWKDMWLTYVLSAIAAHLWNVEVHTFQIHRVSYEDKPSQFPLHHDILQCSTGTPRTKCYLVHSTSGNKLHWDLLLPGERISFVRDNFRVFRGVCTRNCKL
jgi:hypothetical protein